MLQHGQLLTYPAEESVVAWLMRSVSNSYRVQTDIAHYIFIFP